MKPRRAARDRRDQREKWVILISSAVMFCLGIALLVHVATTLRNGYFDARPKGGHTPDLLYADQEPFWFYALTAFMAAMGLFSMSLGWGMMKEVLGRDVKSHLTTARRQGNGKRRRRTR